MTITRKVCLTSQPFSFPGNGDRIPGPVHLCKAERLRVKSRRVPPSHTNMRCLSRRNNMTEYGRRRSPIDGYRSFGLGLACRSRSRMSVSLSPESDHQLFRNRWNVCGACGTDSKRQMICKQMCIRVLLTVTMYMLLHQSSRTVALFPGGEQPCGNNQR